MKLNIHPILKLLARKHTFHASVIKNNTKLINKYKIYRDNYIYGVGAKVDKEIADKMFSAKQVLNGPFKDMIYPEMASVGSTLYPKLLGSYEYELQGIIYHCIQKNYSQIIDIGCAEGFYAVGFAMKIPNCTVYAYDIDATALMLCEKMANINGVTERVFLNSKCSSETLKNFSYVGKTLILCDCEGYEDNLFTSENINVFETHDLLIEVHDFVNEKISSNLIKLFYKTHNIQVIKSLSDSRKPYLINSPELDNLDLEIKYAIMAESRPEEMEWLYCTSKQS
jgi:hypothetical protein